MEIDPEISNQNEVVDDLSGKESISQTLDNQTPIASSSSVLNEKTEHNPIDQSNPICVVILGMAGSGKSSLCARMISEMLSSGRPPYVINCDPACLSVDYVCNVDIRDTIHYKNVMQKYGLGPNGSIMTSLNLFVTNFDQVLTLIDKRKDKYKYVLFDTPGQVEVFTWSASGSIITEALASKFPTVIIFVVDTVRSQNPTTFMSNMLYACSIMYKYKLPMIIVLNKNDVVDHQFAVEWMQHSENFEAAINNDSTYMACLNQSLVGALDIFYQDLPVVGVSSKTGFGFDHLLEAIHLASKTYYETYRPEYERITKEAQVKELSQKTSEINLENEQEDQLSEDLITFGSKTLDQL